MTPAALEPGSCRDARTRYPKLTALVGYLESLKARADLDVLAKLLFDTHITRADIDGGCQFNPNGYKRNPLARTDWFELLAICWRSGHCTPIHDHAGVSCAFKVVEGTGTEIRFARTPSELICPVQTNEMRPGYICAAEDADIHQVANMQEPGRDLITMHIYSPPIVKMNTYKFAVSDGAESGKYDC